MLLNLPPFLLFIVKIKAKYQNHSEKWKTRNKYFTYITSPFF